MDDAYGHEDLMKAIVESMLLFPYDIRHVGPRKYLSYFKDNIENGLYQNTTMVEIIEYDE